MNPFEALHQGVVIPASPLALTAARQLDVQRQRMLWRYYAAAGAGGVAIGVHYHPVCHSGSRYVCAAAGTGKGRIRPD